VIDFLDLLSVDPLVSRKIFFFLACALYMSKLLKSKSLSSDRAKRHPHHGAGATRPDIIASRNNRPILALGLFSRAFLDSIGR